MKKVFFALALLLFAKFNAQGWKTDEQYIQKFALYAVEEMEKYKIPAGNQELSVLTSLKLDGSKVGNDFRLLNLTIEMVFEAKQSDYVTWQQLGTIHFSTELALED